MVNSVLITGGSGFIGSHIVNHLSQIKIKCIVLTRKKSDLKRIITNKNYFNKTYRQFFIEKSSGKSKKI